MKRVLITGASSGIGQATARKFAAEGVDLILLARRKDRLESLKREIEGQYKIKIVTAAVDISQAAQIEKFVNEYRELLATTDVLVNNAGLAQGTDKLQAANIKDWDAMIDTNVKGLLYMSRAVLPFMLKARAGHIVNIGSVAGRWVYPGGGVYCATKFAVRALSEALRMDLNGSGLRVTNIEPGMVETEFARVRFNGDLAKAKKVYSGMTPLTGADIADCVVWAVKCPKHVNIQELVVMPTDQGAIQLVHREEAAKPS